jgi:electron transfer flavoprotein beta subunit
MNILVCVSHVPDTTARIDFVEDGKKYNKTEVQFVINPFDELTLTRALEIKDKTNAKVTVINVGLQETESTIRKALAMGADEAIRVNVEPIDAFQVAVQIAEVFKNGNYDVILTGKESSDYNGSQVGEMVGDILGIPSITSASHLELDEEKAIVTREMSNGYETFEVHFPFVISGQKGIAEEPRIPSMRGIMMARSKKLEVVEPVVVEPLTELLVHELPEEKGKCKLIDPEHLEELVALLHNEAKVI